MSLPTPELWTRENLAWCAGIIEGEGSIHIEGGGFRVVVKMTDLDVLTQLQRILGGRLYGPHLREGRKPIWTWEISRNAQAYAVVVALHGWLHARRREQVRLALEHWVSVNRQRLAQLAVCGRCGGVRKNRIIRGARQGWTCSACQTGARRARRLRVAA